MFPKNQMKLLKQQSPNAESVAGQTSSGVIEEWTWSSPGTNSQTVCLFVCLFVFVCLFALLLDLGWT